MIVEKYLSVPPKISAQSPWNPCMSPYLEKRVFVDVIKLKSLRGGHYPGLLLLALNAIISVLIRGRRGRFQAGEQTQSHRACSNVKIEASIGKMPPQTKEC